MLDTVRSRLTLIILLAMLPVLMFSLANAAREYVERKETAQRELVNSAELVTKEVGAVFAGALQVLTVSRNLAVIRDSEVPACTDYLRGTVAAQDLFSNVATVAANGDVLCSALDVGARRNVADAPWFARFQRMKSFSVGTVLTGSITGQPVLTAALPMDAAAAGPGQTSLVVVSIKANLIDRYARFAPAPDDTELFLMNADGELLIANGPEDALPADLDRVRSAPAQSFVDGASRAGRPYLYAAVQLHEGEIMGLLARPAIRVDAPILAELAIDVALPVLLTAVTLLIVWLATDRVSLRWIRKLRTVALAHGEGTAPVREWEIDQAPLEYRELGDSLNAMAGAIEQRQSRLLSALAGRELLLREIHHRVKNNLQIIISLFNLQARNAEHESEKLLIRDLLARVESLALVHHAAYQSDDVQLISMKSFVPNLITHLSHTLDDRSTDIRIETEVDDIFLTMDETIPLAQLMTEAISNSIKHAFVGRPEGRISFRLLRVAERRLTLEIADDGIGLPANFEQRPARRQLGQSLMSAFARQLGGTVTISSDGGTVIRAELSLLGGERPVPHANSPMT